MPMIPEYDKETIIAFFDIYGFSTFIEDEKKSMEDKISALEKFLERVKNDARSMLGNTDGEDVKFKIEIFSDSIIFKLDTYLDETSIDFFLLICSVLMFRGIRAGFPLRGAIGGGSYYKKNDVLVSSALVDAVKFEKVQDWFGTVITPKALKIIKDKYPVFESEVIEVVKYGTIPWKDDFESKKLDSLCKTDEFFHIICPYGTFTEKYNKNLLKHLTEKKMKTIFENSERVYCAK